MMRRITRRLRALWHRRESQLLVAGNGDGRNAPLAPIAGAASNTARSGGQLVIRLCVPEDKREVSYLSQFRLFNAKAVFG
jgi:hypothetical protein